MKITISVFMLVALLLILPFSEKGFAGEAQSYRCNFAKIQLAPNKTALVRSGPGRQNRVFDRLVGGSIVYICDETEKWFEVSYGSGATPCGAAFKDGLAVDRTRTCKSGWMSKALIEVLSG